MLAITIRQPWASLIADGRKTVELRSWRCRWRGDLLICAGLGRPSADGRRAAARFGMALDELPRGVSLAIVALADCRPAEQEDATEACGPISRGDYAWVLTDPRRVAPFPVRGMPGLWESSL